jgi:hypothetical protein
LAKFPPIQVFKTSKIKGRFRLGDFYHSFNKKNQSFFPEHETNLSSIFYLYK